eukprot:m.365660 g.365660  ORF g.365660 m.365660 type:complete len:73 (+) comp32409_c0_seq1:1-219(+)
MLAVGCESYLYLSGRNQMSMHSKATSTPVHGRRLSDTCTTSKFLRHNLHLAQLHRKQSLVDKLKGLQLPLTS